jgi:hypothetical protein
MLCAGTPSDSDKTIASPALAFAAGEPDTRTVTAASHAFTPPQTPHSSTTPGPPAPSTQQIPLGGSAALQHTPSTSTATPLPPHTPHASMLASDAQQCPAASIDVKPEPQQWPVLFTTIVASQHIPATSTTPPRQLLCEPSLPIDSNAGTLHVVPSQPSAQTHDRVVELPSASAQRELPPMDATQSASPEQPQPDEAGAHTPCDGGGALPHSSLATTTGAPLSPAGATLTHDTVRDVMPGRHGVATPEAPTKLQSLQLPTRHT